MRVKFELEYTLNCSPKVLFPRLSTPEGLGEWFADDISVEGDTFNFVWNKTCTRARLAALKENRLVRFEWICAEEEEEENYFEFRINIDDITGDLALIIIDFAEPEEKEDAVFLWDSQITDLKRLLGM